MSGYIQIPARWEDGLFIVKVLGVKLIGKTSKEIERKLFDALGIKVEILFENNKYYVVSSNVEALLKVIKSVQPYYEDDFRRRIEYPSWYEVDKYGKKA